MAIHVTDAGGSILRSVGPQDTIGPGRPTVGISLFRLTPDGQFVWIGNGYSFSRWRLRDNALVERIEVSDVPWMKQPIYQALPGRVGAPQVRVGGTIISLSGVDGSGRLWLNGRTSDPSISANGEVHRLEVFDPRTGNVVVSQTVPSPLHLLPPGDRVLTGSVDSNGVLRITAWTFRIVGRQTPTEERK
jgi:hypothetical protein